MGNDNLIQLTVIFGGRSGEHEVSLISANSILNQLDKTKYHIQKIGITKEGEWLYFADDPFDNPDDPKNICLKQNGHRLIVNPAPKKDFLQPVDSSCKLSFTTPDVVFPVLHGTFGEDGTLQGLFDLAEIAYVGGGVLGSSLSMDKIAAKQACRAAGLTVAPSLDLLHKGSELASWERVTKELGEDVFIKPANLGSSVGVSHVTKQADFQPALELAFSYDQRVLIEKAVHGLELVCGVLGNENPKASTPGELRTHEKYDFYSYEAKYVDPEGHTLVVPPDLPESTLSEMQSCSVRAFEALNLRGLARVDFFYEQKTQNIVINEVNTIPGFTPSSLYPQMWLHDGLTYPKLLDQLIALGLDYHKQVLALNRSFY